MHELGARRVLVTGTGPLGCVPAELALRSRDGNCDPELQRAAGLFNPQLSQLIRNLNRDIGSEVFIAANAFSMHMDFITNPQGYGKRPFFFSPAPLFSVPDNSASSSLRAGFITSKVACCGQGPYNGIGLCTIASSVCSNRNVYAFWDAFHPSERANRIIVGQFMAGSIDYMSPMNLSTVLEMDARA